MYWTRAKLEILDGYLRGFARASHRAAERIYLDAFAGEGRGRDRLTGDVFKGSARLALDVDDPPFTRLRFFELPERAEELERSLRAEYPDRDVRVYRGDCNVQIPRALAELAHINWAPAFAFLDPDGMELGWETLEAIARHRPARYTKVEQWMLFPSSGLMRTLSLRGEPSDRDYARATALFGTDAWIPIYEARRRGDLGPEGVREEYVNLMRWRLQHDLGYETTYPLQIENTRGAIIYHMIFATDHPVGRDIMKYLYGVAAKRLPQMRDKVRDDARGVQRLFDVSELGPSRSEEYEEPWPPGFSGA